MEDYFSYTPNPRLSKSASETLANYIKDYDRSDNAFDLGCSMGSRDTRKNYCSSLKKSLQKDLSALDEEIILARRLFSNESFDRCTDDLSMTTEELLLEQPYNSFCSSSSESMNHSRCHLRVSELGKEDPYYKKQSSYLGIHRSPVSQVGDHSNRDTFQEFIERENIISPSQLVRPAKCTPVAKIARSKISSDNLEGELRVAMNCGNKDISWKPKESSELWSPVTSISRPTQVNKYDQQRQDHDGRNGCVSVALQLEGKPTSVREFMGGCFREKPAIVTEKTSNAERSAERTVESLKNMLYSLQELSGDAQKELGNSAENLEDKTTDQGYESLEKAMRHLAILKSLVKEVGGTGGVSGRQNF